MAFQPAGISGNVANRSQNDRGPRDNLTNGYTEKNEYKLYVTNLLGGLSLNAIYEIFNAYGEVIGITRDAGWAYVTYRTHREALLAIGSLHNKSPLYMRVEFAKERSTGNVRDWTKQNLSEAVLAETSIAPDYRDAGGLTLGQNVPKKRLEILLPERMRSQNLIPTYDAEDEILYPVEVDPRILNPFENAHPHPHTNIVWTRGRMSISDDGRRQVYMGRGYPIYHIPDHYPRMEANISTTYERRKNGLYEYGEDQLKEEIGRCEFCPNITKMRCSRCSLFYCSRACQRADWDRHKIECQLLPPLTGISNPMEEILPMSNQKEELKERVTMLNQKAKENSRTSLRMPNSRVLGLEQEKPVEASKQQEKRSEVPQEKPLEAPQQEKYFEEPQKARSTSSQKSGLDYSKIDLDIAFQKKSFIPKDKFIKVEIMVVLGNAEYWVQRVDDSHEFTSMMGQLEMSNEGSKVKPSVGSLIACKYFGMWHRASVLSLNPLTVHYLDYGNDEILKDDDIRSLGAFENTPRFARKIVILNGKGTKLESLSEGTELSVKMISEDVKGVITVITLEQEEHSFKSFSNPQNGRDSQNGPESQNKPSQNRSSSQNGYNSQNELNSRNNVSPHKRQMDECPVMDECPPPALSNCLVKEIAALNIATPTGTVLDNLEPKDKGHIELHTQLSKNKYSVTIVPNKLVSSYEMILCELPKQCAQIAETVNYQPKEKGESVLVKRADGDWLRGEVVSVGPPVKVAIVDEGRVSSVERCLPLSAFKSDICTFGGICTILDDNFKVKALETLSFEVISWKTIEGQKGFEVMVTNIDGKELSCKAFLTKWSPLPEQLGVQILELKTDTEVVLTAYRSQHLLYVRSMEDKEVERFNRLLQEVAKKAQTAPKLKSIPVVGQMVIAKFKEDNNYYRAVVTKVEGVNVFITYIDFGNVEISSIKDMLEMPTELKECRSAVAKIVLKDVPNDIPMTEEVAKYFANFVGNEQPLKITFDGIPSEDGVHLKTASRESVNEKVKQLLIPSWKSPEEEKVCFELHDLEIAPLGKVGETVSAIVLHTQEEGLEYFMSPLDIDLISHVSDVLPSLLKKYVDSTTEHYIPRDYELCIAPFSDMWYRAACLKRNITPTSSSIFFVDYGNIDQVEHTNLRLMTKDFITPAALANICKVINLFPKNLEKIPDKVKERLGELLAPNAPTKVKIISIDESNNCVIELPEIRNILLKENLI